MKQPRDTGGVVSEDSSKACETGAVDSRVLLAGNVDSTQALFETPSHKGHMYNSPNYSKHCLCIG